MSTPTKPKPFVRTIHKTEFHQEAVYAVHGFWSGRNVTASRHIDLSTHEWSATKVNWSCGGEDASAEPDRIFAAECFAAAVKDAAKVARRWSKAPLSK